MPKLRLRHRHFGIISIRGPHVQSNNPRFPDRYLPKRRKKKTVILVKNLFLDILQSFKQISKRWRKKVSDRGVSHDPKWPSCSTFYIRKAQLSNKSQNAVNVITSFKNKKSTLFYEIPLRFEILKVRAEIKLFGSRAYSSF